MSSKKNNYWPEEAETDVSSVCAICSRAFGSTGGEKHHLMPRTFKGKDTIYIHKICHENIHRAITERELQHFYHTVDNLLSHPDIQKMNSWLANKDPDFYVRTVETRDRKRKRR